MQIVSDAGMDISPQQMDGAKVHLAPLSIQLAGKTYRSGIDIQPAEFYRLLYETEAMPTTSLPSPGEFASLYRELARGDADILSIHISSGLSGTYQAALSGAEQVPEANVTLVDTMTLSVAQGWQVEAALRGSRAGWAVAEIVQAVERVRQLTETVFTLPDLKYLINGGRISHLKGLLASVLNIKPMIGVSKRDGKYFQRGQQRTFQKALAGIVDVIAQDHPRGTPLRAQVAHAENPEGASRLQELISQVYPCEWLPHTTIAPVLGAHTGPGLVGVAYAALENYPALP
ncbi:MAG: DegV family protein [Anaerolineales bacterium]|nr:DegV family protein [Anaerolineales bacterium]